MKHNLGTSLWPVAAPLPAKNKTQWGLCPVCNTWSFTIDGTMRFHRGCPGTGEKAIRITG